MPLDLIASTIGDAIGRVFGYDPIAVSLFVILFFIIVIVFTGLDLTVGLMIMIPVIIFLTAYAGFPSWLLFIIVLGMGAALYFGVKQVLNR